MRISNFDPREFFYGMDQKSVCLAFRYCMDKKVDSIVSPQKRNFIIIT